MTRMCKKMRKMSKKNKFAVLGLMCLVIVVLVVSIKSTYAYYQTETPFSMLAASVGDFDSSGDVNIVIWKQKTKGSKDYIKTYGVPSVNYKFVPDSTKCSNPTTKVQVTCTNGTTGNCHYTYNETSKSISLTSNDKVTCNFYFDQTISSDIDVYIMIESKDVNDKSYNSKYYQTATAVPATGYTYNAAVCDDKTGTISYDTSNKKFTVSSSVKNTCYVYFNSTSTINTNTQVFVQTAKNSQVYSLVDSIPVGNVYELNEEKSKCVNSQNQKTDASITYDGFVNVTDTDEHQDCNVYLNLE